MTEDGHDAPSRPQNFLVTFKLKPAGEVTRIRNHLDEQVLPKKMLLFFLCKRLWCVSVDLVCLFGLLNLIFRLGDHNYKRFIVSIQS